MNLIISCRNQHFTKLTQVPLHIIAAIVSIVFVIAVALHGRQVKIILTLIFIFFIILLIIIVISIIIIIIIG